MSKIRTCIKSRWENGWLVEADFSQLEVVVQAMLTGSRQLIADLASGTDMHTYRASQMFMIPMPSVSKAQRQLAKQCSFQLAYGAGYKSMAKQLGLSESITKRFVAAFYERYPEIKQFNADNMEHLRRTSKPSRSGRLTPKPYREALWRSPTGRFYNFVETDYLGEAGFSPTQVANYPVQGTAADIVALFRAKLWRMLNSLDASDDYILPIGTVHDSVVFDTSSEAAVNKLVEVLNILLINLNTLLRAYFPNLRTPLQLKMDVKAGRDWSEGDVIASLPVIGDSPTPVTLPHIGSI